MTTTAVLPEHTQSKAFTSGVEVQTNFHVDDTTRMSVDTHGAAHIMSLLTDLYSDPEGTVLREYVSNALDSHVAAGSNDPVQVFLPSGLSNNFVVQDYGTGMSAQEVREIYSSYGKSTKRNDMTQIGAYGLGCKSALTMVQSFTLVSIKDGEKTVAAISRGEDGVGEIKILKVSETDEPNGVRVSIPVSDVSKFLTKAKMFFFTMQPGRVLIDGEEISHNLYNSDYSLVDGTTTYISRNWETNSGWRNSVNVVMGDVAYKINLNEISNHVKYDTRNSVYFNTINGYSLPFSVYSIIPIASIDLTPSREDIRYSDRTKKFLALLVEQIASRFIAHIQKDIEQSPTHLEALTRFRHYNNVVRNGYGNHRLTSTDISWRGHLLKDASFKAQNHRIAIDYSDRTSMVTYEQMNIGDLLSRGKLNASVGAYVLAVPMVVPDPNAPDKVVAAKAAYEINRARLEKIRRNFTQFLRRNTKGADSVNSNADPKQTLYLFEDTLPTNAWFNGVGLFYPVTEQEIFDGAAQWRKDRRTIARSNNSGTSTSTRNLSYSYLTVDHDATNGYSITVGQVDHKGISRDDVYTSDDKVQRTSLRHIARMIEQNRAGAIIGKDRIDRYSSITTSVKELGLLGKKIIMVPSSRKVSALFSRTGFVLDNIENHRKAVHEKAWKALSTDAQSHVLDSSTTRNVSLLLEIIVKHLKKDGLTIDSFGDPTITRLWTCSQEGAQFIKFAESLNYGSVCSTAHPMGVDTSSPSVVRSLVEAFCKTYPLLGALLTAYFSPKDLGADYVLYINAVIESRKEN